MSSSSSSSSTTQAVTRADGTILEVPDKFVCPITLNIMTQPLCNRAGLNYDRQAILSWLETKGTCPLTRQPLRPSQLIPNRLLETQIKQFRQENNYYDDIASNSNGSSAGGQEPSNGSSSKTMEQDEEEHRFIGFLPVSEDKHAEVLERHGLSDSNASSSLIRMVAAASPADTRGRSSNNNSNNRGRNFLGFPRRGGRNNNHRIRCVTF